MMKFLAGVLSVIAIGILLVAYALLAPRTAAFADRAAAPALALEGQDRGGVAPVPAGGYAPAAAAPYATSGAYAYDPRFAAPAPAYGSPYPVYQPMAAPQAQPVQTVITEAPQRQATRTRVIERAPRRNWKKTAAIIGGSSAAGAGIGAIVGGKKGALIGAAIGGGASTIYEAVK